MTGLKYRTIVFDKGMITADFTDEVECGKGIHHQVRKVGEEYTNWGEPLDMGRASIDYESRRHVTFSGYFTNRTECSMLYANARNLALERYDRWYREAKSDFIKINK